MRTVMMGGGALVLAGIGFGAWAVAHSAPGVGGAGFVLAGDPIAVGSMAGRPVASDMDGDGDLDIVIVCGPCCGREPSADSGHALVLLNDGLGGLSPAGPRVQLGDTALGCAIGDVDEDGRPDVVAYHHLSYQAAVMLNEGGGRLRAPVYTTMHNGTSAHVHAVALADVNGDEHLDLLATLVDDHALAVLLGDGTGAFAPAPGQPFFAHQHPYSGINTPDINGDGDTDVVITDVRGGGLTVLVGSGTGMFSPLLGFDLNTRMPITSKERPTACALGDLDDDGDLDAIAFIEEEPFAVRMVNDGKGVFGEHHDPIVRLGHATVGGVLADVTGDGVLDIVASSTMADAVTLCVGDEEGGFGRPVTIGAGGTSPHVCVADMNNDGRPDIVTGNYDSGTVSVLINGGALE